MAHGVEKRQQVRTLYAAGRTLEDAAKEVGVSYNTARTWRNTAKVEGDDWDKARAARRLSGLGTEDAAMAIIEDFLAAHGEAIKQVRENPEISPIQRTQALCGLADAFSKTMAAVGKATPQLSWLGVAMEVLAKLAAFIQAHHPEQAAAFLEILEPFGRELSKEKA
ncbi:MAG: DUF1804 family protein [Magnetococcales bacterium]|nr:DUF1804 family protein [Magnetococcales bacterium]